VHKIGIIAFDMDGLLFSEEEDHIFWEEILPAAVGKEWGMERKEVKRKLGKLFYEVYPRRYWWFDPSTWENLLGVGGLEDLFRKTVVLKKQLLVRRDFLFRLKENYRIGIETNAAEKWAREIVERVCKNMFNFIFTSDIAGAVKPEKKFYLNLLQFLNCNADELLIVTHESAEKVAEELGISVLITTPEKVEEDLKEPLFCKGF